MTTLFQSYSLGCFEEPLTYCFLYEDCSGKGVGKREKERERGWSLWLELFVLTCREGDHFPHLALKINSLALSLSWFFFSFSFSQMTLFLFWCRSFFCELVPIQFRWPAGLCVSENGLAVFSSNCSAHSGLQLGKALHWSWVRDICFIHTGGSFEDCAACRGNLLLFGCLIIF